MTSITLFVNSDLNNDHGIFILNILRMIKYKMIYNNIKEDIDRQLSDSQVGPWGARPNKSIRNHLFVIYSILNSVIVKESVPIGVTVYAIKKCFDTLWLKECCNDLFESGIQDDKLNLLYEGNKVNNVAIKFPAAGLTDCVKIEKIVTQGSSNGPTLSAVQTDIIGKDSIVRKEHLYRYKDEVDITEHIMMDDVDNAYMNVKIKI